MTTYDNKKYLVVYRDSFYISNNDDSSFFFNMLAI